MAGFKGQCVCPINHHFDLRGPLWVPGPNLYQPWSSPFVERGCGRSALHARADVYERVKKAWTIRCVRAPSASIFGLKFAARLNSFWVTGWGRVQLFCIGGVLVMGIEHLLRNKQRRLAEPALWADEPTDDALSLLKEEPALWGDEHADDVHSLLEENARLRALLVQLSDLIRRNVVHAR